MSRGLGQGSHTVFGLGPGGESPGTMLLRAKGYEDVAFDLEFRAARHKPGSGSQPDPQLFGTLCFQVEELRDTARLWRDRAKAVLS